MAWFSPPLKSLVPPMGPGTQKVPNKHLLNDQATQHSGSLSSLRRQQQMHTMTSQRAEMCSEDCLKSAVLQEAHHLALKPVTAITTLADDSWCCESSPEPCTYLVTWMGRRERHFPLIRNGESKSCFLPTSSFNRYSQKPNWCQALC